MKETNIKELRAFIEKQLETYNDIPILFDSIDKDLLDSIIFTKEKEIVKIDGIYKEIIKKKFALSKAVLKKIDFSNVSFDNVSIKAFDFTGLKGVKIDPQTIYKKDMSNTILEGVTFTNYFHNVKIIGANFTKSVGAIINPQTICNKNMKGCVLTNVEFVGLFDGVNIEYSNFKGSDGAIIFIDKLKGKSIKGTNLCDTFVYLNASSIEGVKYIGVEGDVSYDEEKLKGIKNKILKQLRK